MCLHVWVRFKLHFYKKNFRGILTWIVSVVGGGTPTTRPQPVSVYFKTKNASNDERNNRARTALS